MDEDLLARDIIRLVQTEGETPMEILRGPVGFGIAVGAFLARLDKQPEALAGPLRAAFAAGLCRGTSDPKDACELLREITALLDMHTA